MSEFSYLTDRLADQQIRERIALTERASLVRRHRRAGRRSLANGLHHLANRLDT
jgi:hypothetical protein